MADAASNSTPNSRQKRVLPSRPRRGGPGIGSCDVDLMILDAQRRRFDNEPLIPADTPFLLTTDSTYLDDSGCANTFQQSTVARQRYFDRPDVIKAYREQQIIQTPEFTLLPEDASVGGRFRPRSSVEQVSVDISDAAYEKRHRKYETFEKRQRLREKEKLKHEQYKLKERIEQLRAMDSSAFLALPASSFPLPRETDHTADGVGSSLHANGASAHSEGERRRQQMLEVASMLEERYRTLLPSDKKLADLKTASRQSSVNLSSSDVRHLEELASPAPQPNNSSIILKIKVPPTRQKDDRAHLWLFPSSPKANSEALSHSSMSPTKPVPQKGSSERSRKRPREDSDSPYSTPDRYTKHAHSGTPKAEACVLVQWAERHRSSLNTRKTQRHVTAFGTKVPSEIEEVRDFEIPSWIRAPSPSATSDAREECMVVSTEPPAAT
ncbi:hypothetical protein EDD17DRAFT_440613 [Pisolithus thermaeus]|nr:hypothetical protein EDD17DRAFT_440613 [Pisolithus thermaeus]